jgi:hypothetical protein
MHFGPATILSDWPSRCPCGAAAAHRYGLCTKCQARAAWKRRKAPARHTTRRTAKRISRRVRRLLPAPRAVRPAIAHTADRSR